MTPDFRILADSVDVTDRLRDRLLSLRITDEAGIQSDTVEIYLDDRDGKIDWPRHGAELDVSLGYRETGLTQQGLYIVDEVEHSGSPNTFTIRAKAADMRASLKAQKTRSWDQLTIDDLVNTIAAEHDLTPKVNDVLGRFLMAHIDQSEESDLHLLTRLAKEYDAIAKPVSGFLVFAPQGDSKSVSDQDLPTVAIEPIQIIRHRLTQADRGKYSSVKAYWHNTESAERVPVQVGDGEPVFTLRHTYANRQEAERAAESKLKSLQRGTASLNLTLLGNVELLVEGKLQLMNIRTGFDGEWIIQRLEHQLNDQGLVTRVESETPNPKGVNS